MNPLNINHIKVEKAKAIKLRYQKLRKITRFFRVFEIILILAVISRLSLQLPLALFKLSNECFYSLSIFIVSPKFVFIIGNAIVITLFVNSGRLSSNECSPKTTKTPPYQRKNKNMMKVDQKSCKKQGIITEENAMMAMIFPPSEQQQQVIKIYQRSKSEKMIIKREKVEKKCCGLRRSNTEIKSLKGCGCSNDVKECHYPEDHMSNEEFQKTIENFIARQQKFLREEEFSALKE
ncbi:hypothetical protein SOVF_062670 [Spinacia oleracea]|uniref:DUF4408 domain-containing protein n=1 Tax=Spinacia oleracea TaxID=3562 RepID=A0A9R0JA30_SPIOL|nr:uncharacterized protein LOC110803077 [Spinacia oleracea]KNA19282.1 hypothetical protein SOVF_062670 [Spinacia oleracea]